VHVIPVVVPVSTVPVPVRVLPVVVHVCPWSRRPARSLLLKILCRRRLQPRLPQLHTPRRKPCGCLVRG
jgi:hypothetical protein